MFFHWRFSEVDETSSFLGISYFLSKKYEIPKCLSALAWNEQTLEGHSLPSDPYAGVGLLLTV